VAVGLEVDDDRISGDRNLRLQPLAGGGGDVAFAVELEIARPGVEFLVAAEDLEKSSSLPVWT